MKRREFLITLVLSATLQCAHAQQGRKLYRIAIVSPSAPAAEMTEAGSPVFGALFKELRRLGYVEGQNVQVERYSGAGRTEPELATEVVRHNPDLILAFTSRMVLNFKVATTAIPIVGLMADPIAFGIVESLAHPGGNITGIVTDAGPEIWGKRLDLLREAAPGTSRVGFLAFRRSWETPSWIGGLRVAAERMGISVIGPPLEEGIQEQEYRRVFAAMLQGHADALIVGDSGITFTYRKLIVELAEASGLPAIYPYREQAEAGGLMAYGPDLLDVHRLAAGYIDKILKGTKAGEIPIYLAVKFDLVVNMKAAKAIGLTIPPALLLRADEIIE